MTQVTAEQRQKLIDQVFANQNILNIYPSLPDGRPDFDAKTVDMPVSKEDVEFVIDRYLSHRASGMSHGEACRITYSCFYRSTDISFNPHKRVAELRAQK
jgi:hypothetical protein